MKIIDVRRLLSTAVAGCALLLAAPCATALDSLKVIVPAAPGGGWDQTGRALQAALQADKIVPRVTVDNKGGAGGTIGLAQFITSSKGDANTMLIGGMVISAPNWRIPGRSGAGIIEAAVDEGTGGPGQGQPGQRGLGRRFRRR